LTLKIRSRRIKFGHDAGCLKSGITGLKYRLGTAWI
jgi:hypothetical protein